MADRAGTPVPLDDAIAHYRAHGYARLGRVLDEAECDVLRARADDLMLGRIVHEGMFFQADTNTGRYDDLTYGRGYVGPSLNYRKLEKLELDDVFRALIVHPRLEAIARGVIDGPISIYRAVLMNKAAAPAGPTGDAVGVGGTDLPWHQDAGRLWGLDRDPELQVWIALDDAPEAAGCVEVVPGSHRRGLASPLGGMIAAEITSAAGAEASAVTVPVRAGEGLLIHNLAWHRSGVNRTTHPRRAVTVCYMSAVTRCTRTRRAPRVFPVVFP